MDLYLSKHWRWLEIGLYFLACAMAATTRIPIPNISVQPEKDKAEPLGIEKVFFDFCKKSEILA